MKARVAIALGSNDADAAAKVREAFSHLQEILHDARLSPLYASAPMYYADQPRFVNAVAVGGAELTPADLLAWLKNLEREMGRMTTFRNGPRLIDLDIVFYGDEVIEQGDLIVPHPRMAERPFVMAPLAALAPEWLHPLTGASVGVMAADLEYGDEDLHELA